MAKNYYVLREPEEVYNIPLVPEDTPEDMLEGIRLKNISGYTIESIITGNTCRAAVYPHWAKRTDVPQKPRRERSPEEIAAANERRSIQRGQDLIAANFWKGDIYFTGTFDNERIPKNDKELVRYIQNFIKRIRSLHKKNGGKAKDFKYFYTYEVDEAEGIRQNVHILIHASLSMDEVEMKWNGGGRNQTRKVVPDKDGIIGLAVYTTKPIGKRKRRWGSSKGLKQPVVRKAYKKTTKAQVKKAAEAMVNLEDFFKKMYPAWEITQVSKPAYNDKNGGVYLYARMKIKPDRGKSNPPAK